MATGLLAFLGLSFDIGYIQWKRRQLQIAADSAAVAAVTEILAGSTNAVASAAAKTDAGLNGFTDGTNGVTVTVNTPPSSGYDMANSAAAEVIVSQSAPIYFLRIFGLSTVPVKARSAGKPGPNTDCIFVLSPNAVSALSITGSEIMNLSCGAMVDSTSASAFSLTGSVVFNGSSSVVGGYSATGSITWNPSPPSTGATAESDPLAYIPAPAVGACNHTNYNLTGSSSVTLNPGVYCNGISVTGSSTLTFNPGTYILQGGGLSVTGSASLSGTGVTFYNTQGSGYTYGPISITGSVSANFSAPTTGSLAGMLFFQDRTIAAPAASSVTGSATENFAGALYFPTSALSYTGSSNGQYTILVAKTLSFTGSSVVGSNYSSLAGGSPLRGPAILSE